MSETTGIMDDAERARVVARLERRRPWGLLPGRPEEASREVSGVVLLYDLYGVEPDADDGLLAQQAEAPLGSDVALRQKELSVVLSLLGEETKEPVSVAQAHV